MKKIIFFCLIFLVFHQGKGQNITQKFYSFNFELFPVKQKVLPKSVKRIYYPYTKKLKYIVEYNEFGQRNGMQINYNIDGTILSAVYFIEEKPVYEMVTFNNSNKPRKIINKNIDGQFDGKQLNWFLDSNNKWTNFTFDFKDGRLKHIANVKLDFPEYAVNFDNGLLNGIFYYYDDLQCLCYYFGGANKGSIVSIMKIKIDPSLNFTMEGLNVKDNNLNEIYIDQNKTFKKDYEIKSYPIFVQNDQVKFNNEKDNDRVLFSTQMDLSGTLLSRMISSYKKNIDEDTPKQIDMSDASVPAPSPYKIK